MIAMTFRFGGLRSLCRLAPCALAAACLSLVPVSEALAHRGASDASALSLMPVAVSVAAPVAVLSAGAALTLVAVEDSAEGTAWVLERASDGVRATLRFSGQVAGGVSYGIGSAIQVTAVASGLILSAAGTTIAFVPNEIGKALLHNERLSR
jgi:hypothetical protein